MLFPVIMAVKQIPIIMRVMDILLAIPSMLLATAIVAALGTSIWNVMIAIAIAYIPTFARTVRAAVLTVKDQDFIEAARSIGCGNGTIIFQYIIPNALAPIIVQATLGLAGAILSIAGLSFLGLGIQPPTPEWGAMLSNARVYILRCMACDCDSGTWNHADDSFVKPDG